MEITQIFKESQNQVSLAFADLFVALFAMTFKVSISLIIIIIIVIVVIVVVVIVIMVTFDIIQFCYVL